MKRLIVAASRELSYCHKIIFLLVLVRDCGLRDNNNNNNNNGNISTSCFLYPYVLHLIQRTLKIEIGTKNLNILCRFVFEMGLFRGQRDPIAAYCSLCIRARSALKTFAFRCYGYCTVRSCNCQTVMRKSLKIIYDVVAIRRPFFAYPHTGTRFALTVCLLVVSCEHSSN